MVPYRARVYRDEGGIFAQLRHRRILIYWPHGLGDAVHLGYILPTLDPSNRYYISRYGDDYVALFAGDTIAQPLYTGIRSTHNDFGASARDLHLGIPYKSVHGQLATLMLTPTLAKQLKELEIEDILWTDYPDPAGRRAYPYHTKARSLIAALAPETCRTHLATTLRLPTSLSFEPDPEIAAAIDMELQDAGLADHSICAIQSGGHTNPAKGWPELECRAWAEEFCRLYPNWHAVFLDLSKGEPAPTDLTGRMHGMSDLFHVVLQHYPYAAVLKAFLSRVQLMVGIPAGPFHLAMAFGHIPCVGLWYAHHPLWYDEWHPRARHCVSRRVANLGYESARATQSVPSQYHERLWRYETLALSSEAIFAAVEEVLEPLHQAPRRDSF